jgi:uncharacterized membrane protein YdjX (TVP38/TMEM64 family)
MQHQGPATAAATCWEQLQHPEWHLLDAPALTDLATQPAASQHLKAASCKQVCAEFCASLFAAGVQVVVAVAILMLYIILQAFAIPGTAYLSLIVGALYGPTQGLVMVALISTLGSSACYAMSALFGAPIAHALWRDKLDDFRGKVTDRSNDLLSYIIFLRVTPILPNTFINVASPIVGVPFRPFFIGRHLLHLDPPTLLLHGHGCHHARHTAEGPHIPIAGLQECCSSWALLLVA